MFQKLSSVSPNLTGGTNTAVVLMVEYAGLPSPRGQSESVSQYHVVIEELVNSSPPQGGDRNSNFLGNTMPVYSNRQRNNVENVDSSSSNLLSGTTILARRFETGSERNDRRRRAGAGCNLSYPN